MLSFRTLSYQKTNTPLQYAHTIWRKSCHVGSKRIPKDVSDEAYASLFLDDEFDDAGDPNYICKGGDQFG